MGSAVVVLFFQAIMNAIIGEAMRAAVVRGDDKALKRARELTGLRCKSPKCYLTSMSLARLRDTFAVELLLAGVP